MVLLHLLDPERLHIHRSWSLTSVWLLLPGLVLATFAVVLGNTSNLPTTFLAAAAGVGAALAVAGIAAAIAAARTSVLTVRGTEAAAAFRAVRDILFALALSKLPAAPADFERWLPVAVGLGLGTQSAARFRGDDDGAGAGGRSSAAG